MNKKDIKIFIISGKARNGKTTIGNYIKEYYENKNLKVANCLFAAYIKYYAKNYFGWDGRDETKPRTLLQQLGTEIIRKNIRDTFFIERMIDDIDVLSYFFDIIVIDDARFEKEIIMIKENFNDVITINVVRENYETELSAEQQTHASETGLDNYDNYDYKLINNNLEKLKEDVIDILEDKYEY